MPSLALTLCLMALAPTVSILAAPIVHQNLAPITTSPTSAPTHTASIHTALTILPASPNSIVPSVPASPTIHPNALPASPAVNPLSAASAAVTKIPTLIIPETDKSGDSAHVLPAAIQGRSAASVAKIGAMSTHSQSNSAPSSRPTPLPPPPPPPPSPISDEVRVEDVSDNAPVIAASSEKTASAAGEDMPLVISTKDDRPDCTVIRGGCNITPSS